MKRCQLPKEFMTGFENSSTIKLVKTGLRMDIRGEKKVLSWSMDVPSKKSTHGGLEI